jgi:predicted nucleic acid-binding protein
LTVLVDTGVLVAFHNRRDVKHGDALKLVTEIAGGQHGTAYTTDYVFDEAVTVALTRTRRSDVAVALGKFILGRDVPIFMELVNIDEETFMRAWEMFEKYSEKGLSFTDCASLTVMEIRKIDRIASFDTGFDGLTVRVS